MMLPKSIRTQNGCWNCKHKLFTGDPMGERYNCVRHHQWPLKSQMPKFDNGALLYLRDFAKGESYCFSEDWYKQYFPDITKEKAAELHTDGERWLEGTNVCEWQICDEWELKPRLDWHPCNS